MNYKDWTKIHNAVNHSGTPDPEKGFSGWQQRCQIVRGAIMEARKQIDEEKAGLADTFSQKEVERRSAALEASYEGIASMGREKLEAGLQTVIDAKREQFKKVALTAPTPEQLRLLQAMAMRDDLTESEIAEVAADMGDCLQGLKSLGAIARRAGIDFPHTITTEDFNRQLATAEEFSRSMLRSLDKPDGDLGYNELAFWKYTDRATPKAVYGPVDSPLYSAVQLQPKEDKAEDKPVKEKPQEPPKPLPVVHVTDGIDSLTWLAAKYKTSPRAIIAENAHADLDRVKTTDHLPADVTLTITPGENYEGEGF